jgi:CRP-like cAMP-binding protein
MISLFRYFRAIQPLSEALRDHLEDSLRQKTLDKKDFLLKTGQVCGNIYFVEKGLLRSFYIKDEKEISSGFSKEGDICVSPESFLTQQYSQESIHALEDTTVWYLSYDELQRIYREFPEFNKIGRVLLEKCLIQSKVWVREMWMRKSADRYDWLVRQHPDFPARIAAKHLASYLGVTESMISRVKSKR